MEDTLLNIWFKPGACVKEFAFAETHPDFAEFEAPCADSCDDVDIVYDFAILHLDEYNEFVKKYDAEEKIKKNKRDAQYFPVLYEYMKEYNRKMQIRGYYMDKSGYYNKKLEGFPIPESLIHPGSYILEMLTSTVRNFLYEHNYMPISLEKAIENKYLRGFGNKPYVKHLEELFKQVGNLNLKNAWLEQYVSCPLVMLEGIHEDDISLTILKWYRDALFHMKDDVNRFMKWYREKTIPSGDNNYGSRLITSTYNKLIA